MLVLFCPISALQKQNTCQVSVHYQNLHFKTKWFVCIEVFLLDTFRKDFENLCLTSICIYQNNDNFSIDFKVFFCTFHLKSFYLNNDNFSIANADFEVSVFLYFSYKKDRKLSKFGDVHWNRYRHFQSIKLIKSERTFKTT